MSLRKQVTLLTLAAACAAPSSTPTTYQDEKSRVSRALQDFAQDFQSDPAAAEHSLTFGIDVASVGQWHVVLDGEGSTELKPGPPPGPTMWFTLDVPALDKLHSGTWSSLTAMAKERGSDPSPLNFKASEGFVRQRDFPPSVLPFAFHFWNRGHPEVLNFGSKAGTRFTHGTNASLFYYQPGFRSGWFYIEPGQHVNADPELQTNPFPSLLIITDGVLKCRIGGRELDLKANQTLFIPEEVTHEFWNHGQTPVEGFLLMFGEGA